MSRMEVAGLRTGLPFMQLLDPERVAGVDASATLPGHFLGLPPDTLWMLAGSVHYEQRASGVTLVLNDARFTHSGHPEADLYVAADSVDLTGAYITLRGITVHIGGLDIGSWPQYTIRREKRRRLYSLGLPTVNVGGDGIAWKQPVYFDLGYVKTDLLLDYSEEFELLTKGYTYLTPVEGLEVGVEYGGQAQVDTRRVDYELHTDYNAVLRQRFTAPCWGVRRAQLSAEYGEHTLKTTGSLSEGVPAGRWDDERLALGGDVEFSLVPLAGGWYATSGVAGKYIEYRDAGEDYRVLSGRAGLIYRNGRFDNFVLYRISDASGTPVFAPDAVRQEQVDFAASFRVHPKWRHVVQGVYDIGRDELHTLEVSALKRQRSFELGVYWDFVRDIAGIEVGLLVD
jgi:hypothetical protein